MQIDQTLLSKLEKLSALKIVDEKKTELVEQLSEIVSFVEKLNELDLSSSEIMISATKGETPLRADIPKDSTIIDTILEHSPKNFEHFFLVPKIVE
ncbi:Asp-tRNA(Asn)/Glu-tRNA(Gln) amidotransferase subunit GatC [Campylobacter sp. MIT 21-1685]|uniref:Asp-tRNA(Asn)/Glu-tRNA(Gln) amidotransferase subunit GatC n=1 Tax=unclassified Campylobacter TaxID=2593542 RepID=UPI00224B6D71|nr:MULTISPECIES: Asp-tRNA(Asn)/Glu-tRNA(Gln) amidotransferase subunit GatC [unclassified Campylobacter]MCX2682447.1 Asp-tRNA(Asn)/Glu-tRNA(Gln) amidotransferase subunit GatC [Campylobacter sp. MIT 21-1684]MCX2750840.1 Asp-tRNA(Asn)/Glu-tRNA(Gln) amidotransferase subunit GatC [Campylobacter sp. MIT 21-1682]MCX2806928.1 Asp-tRNA(Asn)/Glu-tRNA(Gln) amidotransferase subunit GatC [Campylobacter sp. MIT 21-1685]